MIQASFGLDDYMKRRAKAWAQRLSCDEKRRREAFQSRFRSIYIPFSELPMSRARVETTHRGVPPVVAAVSGFSLEAMQGSPTEKVPNMMVPGIGDVIGPQWWVPTPDNFFLYKLDPAGQPQRHPLFLRCMKYLEAAKGLIADARGIYDEVHAGQPLMPPPPV